MLPTFENFVQTGGARQTNESAAGIQPIAVTASADIYNPANIRQLKDHGWNAKTMATLLSKYAEACLKVETDYPKIQKVMDQLEKDNPGLDLVVHGTECDLNAGGNQKHFKAGVKVIIYIGATSNDEVKRLSPIVSKEMKQFGVETDAKLLADAQVEFTLIYGDFDPFNTAA